MTSENTIPTKAAIEAILPALRVIANTTPFSFPRIAHSVTANPDVNIELPTPSGSPVTINAFVACGPVWEVAVSGASWKLTSADEVRITAGVLAVAQSLAALLASIGGR